VDAIQNESSKQTPGTATPRKLNETQQELAAAKGRHKEISRQVDVEISRALKAGETSRNSVVLAVLAHNSGRPADFRALLRRIKDEQFKGKSYLDYLRAVAALQIGETALAERLLYGSMKAEHFAIEPPVLLLSVLGRSGYAAREGEINEVERFADMNFDADVYTPVASLVSLHYRLGIMALAAKRCDRALEEFKKAQSNLSAIEKYWTGKNVRDLLDIGEANALYCQKRTVDASTLFNKVAGRATSKDARGLLCMQFSGACDRP
jgi:hypothetical protein